MIKSLSKFICITFLLIQIQYITLILMRKSGSFRVCDKLFESLKLFSIMVTNSLLKLRRDKCSNN